MRLAPKTRFGLMFVVHQVIALWVVAVSAPILTASVFNFMHLFGWQHVRSAYSWVLIGTPFFPAHVILGLSLGWLLARSLQERSMLWVWLFPSFAMIYALIAIPTLTPRLVMSGFYAGVVQSRWSHYFGWGCQLGNYCLDQTSFTRPFYASLAYSLAALIAMKTSTPSRRSAVVHYWIVLTVGVIFLVAAIYDTFQSVRLGGWYWQYLPIEGTLAAMGAYLILLALSAPDESVGETAGPNHTAFLS
jgi:hypothetical protein